MELAGDRPTDQIAFFGDPEAFQSSIGRRDQCLGRFPFVLGCAKDRTERKRPPSPELRSAWNALLRRTGTCSSCQHQTQRDHFGKNWTIKAAGSGEGAFASG